MRQLPFLLLATLLCTCGRAPEADNGPAYPRVTVTTEPEAAAEMARKIRSEANVQLDGDLELSLWASDTLVHDPIAISVAPDGRVFYTNATRQGNSEFDLRGHRDWTTASLSFQTVEDRSKFLRETFSAGSEQSERHLNDLNEDGVRDWRDLAVAKEKVWIVSDRSGDGVADRSQLYLEDFHQEHTDVANGVEYANGEVYISVGPDLWKTSDTNGDSIADVTESLSHGYIVHVGFSGHGMSGVTVGPQGRIWWGQGDVGMNVTDQDGKHWKYPNQGTVVRCDPDGSNFEVFAHGVRNTHEFAFDDYGNLITVDNDGDHSGEHERLVYLIDGSDSGWRINWQFGKYTDPKNNDYKVWMDERMHEPRWEGQAAYMLPPIAPYVNGPTGLVYNPGTALGPEYYGHFFVSEFRGSPGNSPLHAFTLRPEGAGFALDGTREVVSGLLPTGIDWGADGSLYVADWVNGWGVKDEGRIWKLDVPGGARTPVRREVERLLTSDWTAIPPDSLQLLLGHQDQRIRREAQFELADRGAEGYDRLVATARDAGADQLARIHGIWGISQMVRRGQTDETGDALTDLLNDGDAEIIAQSARIIGDLKYDGATDRLIELLDHDDSRVRFMSAEALGRAEAREAVQPILDMLEANDDADAHLRMGGIIALGRIGDAESMVALHDHPSRALRTAAVVALRRMDSPEIARFLDDEDEYIVAEAARAINDDWSIEAALPDLAAVLEEERFTGEPLLRRAINANVRVGDEESVNRLIDYAARPSAPAAMRAEALAALAHWGSPSLFDRVDGRYRGELERDSTVVSRALAQEIEGLLRRGTKEEVRMAAVRAAGSLNMAGTVTTLTRLLESDPAPHLRAAALDALARMNDPALDRKLETALADRDATVRALALEILPASDIDPERSVALYQRVLTSGTTVEQQSALRGLAAIPGPESAALLGEQIGRMDEDVLPAAVRLDLVEAVEQHGDPEINALLTSYEGTLDTTLGFYTLALEGGDAGRGRHLFYNDESAQCVRCHAVFEYGGNVGPGLANIGNELSKRQLLEALVLPSARLAPGYETVLVTLTDGEIFSGIVTERTEETLTVRIGREDIRTIPYTDIQEEETLPSSMPSMAERLSRGEIRDLVAFLDGLRGHES